ncbi:MULTISPECIES: dihydrofolate reductase family protein [Rhizobium/Agrobacterium group]|jgi:riboflavin biosynthesis pyrimidine reductase|uniref:dihydrofolate reductase family protein n=1 Tax=Rhizobium/Agrobacterium group TaxID=227290 RepID=UPI00069C31C0|nr:MULTISPECIES: dihydrofolate reductase family protein [Rhizobium/Agrobacterium group]TKT42645.1 5-amino-6-(5-phosphoribosylamino)uracil reductase [Rhizobiaceae bacterium LC148]
MRPNIICHMISSIDGRLLTERWNAPNGEPATGLIHRVYEEAAGRLGGQGWMVGRRTMAHYIEDQRKPQLLEQPLKRPAFKGSPAGRKLAVVLDPSGKLLHAGDDLDGDHVVSIVSERVEEAYLESLRRNGVSYLLSGSDGSGLSDAVAALGEMFDVKTILLQGGGTINGAFLAAGLIDEFSTLIFPSVDGMAGIASIVDYHGSRTTQPSSDFRFQLAGNETLEAGTVWLRHKVLRRHVA